MGNSDRDLAAGLPGVSGARPKLGQTSEIRPNPGQPQLDLAVLRVARTLLRGHGVATPRSISILLASRQSCSQNLSEWACRARQSSA